MTVEVDEDQDQAEVEARFVRDVQYGLQEWNPDPPKTRAVGTRSSKLQDLVEQVINDKEYYGRWVGIASYGNRTSAIICRKMLRERFPELEFQVGTQDGRSVVGVKCGDGEIEEEF
jgi:hypothetical protein